MVNDAGLPEIYVQPGETRLVEQPAILRTVLGSCVGIAFFEPRLGVAALCHPMLPRRPEKSAKGARESRRFVDYAIRDIAQRLMEKGIEPRAVHVKMFGGADVLAVSRSMLRPTIGQMNYETAEQVLREEGFQIAVSRVGGTSGLRVEFNTGTGEVLVRRLA